MALVQGACVAGGCGLATAHDFVVAADDARFMYSEVRIGFVAALVATFLPLRVRGERAARAAALPAPHRRERGARDRPGQPCRAARRPRGGRAGAGRGRARATPAASRSRVPSGCCSTSWGGRSTRRSTSPPRERRGARSPTTAGAASPLPRAQAGAELAVKPGAGRHVRLPALLTTATTSSAAEATAASTHPSTSPGGT